jgi:2,3-bisphosphoglycerate-independent phosphoglycerate mutase
MKYAIILPDGAADEPLPQLSGRTPLQAARHPNMDWVVSNGAFGRVVTIPEGFTAGTDVGTLTLMGYDAHQSYSGRAPLEAAAKKLRVAPDQIVFRCNFVTVTDGKMKDFTAGHISQKDADDLVAALNASDFPGERCVFHAGVSYRNLMLLANASSIRPTCAPPHDIADQPVDRYWPKGDGADRAIAIMHRAAEMLANHPVNRRRVEKGEAPATNIWLWGQGSPIKLASLKERFGLTGAAITAVDILRGIAVSMGIDLIEVPGATGYIDTDYDAKGRAAIKALEDHDLVIVHVEAPDETGHQGLAEEKTTAIERIDQAVVGPVLQALRKYPEWRMLIAPDHPTPVATKAHCSKPPPFAFAGTGVAASGSARFTEADAVASGYVVDPGHTLLSAFLGLTPR